MAAELRDARPADAQPTDKVFQPVPKMPRFKKDLAAAGIRRIDGSGRAVDFHSLRVSYGTMLAKAGVAPRVAMELMRHTDMRLTMNIYTDPTILNTSRAVSELPDLVDNDRSNNSATVARKTGTDDMPVDGPSQSIALNRDSQCPSGSICDHNATSKRPKTPIKQGFLMEAAGIEPASRDVSMPASTCVLAVLVLARWAR